VMTACACIATLPHRPSARQRHWNRWRCATVSGSGSRRAAASRRAAILATPMASPCSAPRAASSAVLTCACGDGLMKTGACCSTATTRCRHRAVDRPSVALDAVAALALGDVERAIGAFHERGVVVTRCGDDHAGAEGDAGAAAYGREAVRGDGGADAINADQRVVERGVRQQQREFLAAVAGKDVGLAQKLLHACDELTQHFIAGVVAERVVEFLEMIDVEQRERGRLAAARG